VGSEADEDSGEQGNKKTHEGLNNM
jgi:hypothetical protein